MVFADSPSLAVICTLPDESPVRVAPPTVAGVTSALTALLTVPTATAAPPPKNRPALPSRAFTSAALSRVMAPSCLLPLTAEAATLTVGAVV